MKRLSIIFLIPLLLIAARANAQEEVKVIKNFLHDVHETDMNSEEIAKIYIWFEPGNSDTMDIRVSRAGHLISYIRKGGGCEKCEKCQNCKIIFNEEKHEIVPLAQLGNIPHLDFSDKPVAQKKNIYAVVEDDKKVLQYFLLSNGKIVSFFYMLKGGETPYFFGF